MTGHGVRRPRRIVVVGTTFGRMYLEAIRYCADVRLVAILGRGSEVSHRIAEAAGVPLLASAAEIPDDTDLACVAVRTGSVGGAGTDIATSLLERGIPVLHELPVGSRDVAACLRAARGGGASFAVADLYRRLPSVRAFLAAAGELTAAETPLAVDAHLSIQPAYALASILTEIGIAPRPFSFGPVGDGGLMVGTIGGVPASVRFATMLDARETDNDVRFPAVSVHTASGTLTLTDVHGPVLWTPTLHLPSGAKGATAGLDRERLEDVTASEQLSGPAGTHAEVLADLWPRALAREIEAALGRPSAAAAQRTLQVAQMWEAMTAGVEFPAASGIPADFSERTALLARLRAAATAQTDDERRTTDEEPR